MSYFNAKLKRLTVERVEVYKSDAFIVRRDPLHKIVDVRPFFAMDVDGTVITNQSLRQPITEFSKSSRKRLAFVAANTSVEFNRMVTLTYPKEFPKDGRIVKKHLNSFIQWMRRRSIVDYLWFMEFQKRGAPHFHLIYNGGYIDRNKIAERWYKIVGSGDVKHLAAGTRIETTRSRDGLSRYIVKYAQKLQQKDVPKEFSNVGRLWGCSRSVKPQPVEVIAVDAESDVLKLISGWGLLDDSEVRKYNTLFNAAGVISANLDRYNSGVGG